MGVDLPFDSAGFQALSAIVREAFQQMTVRTTQERSARREVFMVDTEEVFQEYLKAFPPGTNPIYRVRTEHDCSCCKQFIRNVGAVVTLSDMLEIQTVWDAAAEAAPYPYNVVAQQMRDYVRSRPIVHVYRVTEKGFGSEVTYSSDADQTVHTWRHFSTGEIPAWLRQAHPDQVQGEYRTTVQVFRRGLEELSVDALEIVRDLISANTLYRGQEHEPALRAFLAAKRQYMDYSPAKRERFVWSFAHMPVARFRNTVIGSLIVDLSSGMPLEQAVRAFEVKVAPQNYQRPTALVTPKMITDAVKKIEELGLTSALDRRFARVDDIAVQDVIWVNGRTRPQMKGGLAQLLQASVKPLVHSVAPTATQITLAEFLALLPEVSDLEVFVSGQFSGNFVSLTAPVYPDVQPLFKWDNNFAWSYTNGVTDSIKERVKKAGGNVTNALVRVSLSWSNHDDLDIHVYEPDGYHIYFASRNSLHGAGGLDVDMNAGGGTSRTPVENVSWSKCLDGQYKVSVHQFMLRERTDVGFTVELENQGKLTQYHYPKMVTQGQMIPVIDFVVSSGVVTSIKVHDGISSQAISSTKWGVTSEQWGPVNVVTRSPNYWGGNQVGNEHLFFLLDGCLSDEPTRGIFNEYLRGDLTEHRKVFELVGEKTKCVPTEGQLSGLGFSTTQHVEVPVQVTLRSGGRRQFKVQF